MAKKKKAPAPRSKEAKRKRKSAPNLVTPKGGRIQTTPETIDDQLKQIGRTEK